MLAGAHTIPEASKLSIGVIYSYDVLAGTETNRRPHYAVALCRMTGVHLRKTEISQ